MLNLRPITAPRAEPISLRDALIHLRRIADSDPVDSPDAGGPDDSKILMLISAARTHAEGFTGRCFADANYEVRFNSFWHGCNWAWFPHIPIESALWVNGYGGFLSRQDGLMLPISPVREILSVNYVDNDGNEQVLAPESYVFDDNPDAPQLRPLFGQSWPQTQPSPNCVRIQFAAGYGPTMSDDSPPVVNPMPVPYQAIAAMKLLIGEWYENAEAAVIEGRAVVLELPDGVRSLLTPLRTTMGV